MPPEFEIVKTGEGTFVGYTQEDQKLYAAFRKKCDAMEPGEFLRTKVTYPRHVKFHRKFMKMMQFAFENWEPEKSRKRMTYKGLPIQKSFDRFRKDITILAGYGEAKFDARGRVSMDAQSLAFENMEQDIFENVYAAVYEVLFTRIFEAKGYSRETLNDVLAKFERFQPT